MRISRSAWRACLLVAAIVVAACQLPGSTTTAGSSQATSANLAGGHLPVLPSGPVFIRVIEFEQNVGGSFTSQKHVPGLIYVASGVHHLVIVDGPSVDLRAGDAYFLGSLSHLHINPESQRNRWYFLALWPTAARSAPLVDPSASVVFETPDLPVQSLPPGPYVNNLTAGGGIYRPPNTAVQEFNIGNTEAHYLATADDAPFQTPVKESP
jgi:hypothetical protein